MKDLSQKLDYWVLTPFFPSADSFRGGFIYDQVNSIMNSKKYRKVVIFKPCGYGEEAVDYEYKGIKVYRFRVMSTPSYLFNGFFNKINNYLFMQELKKRKFNWDDVGVLHIHSTHLAWGALGSFAKPLCFTILQHHNLDPLLLKNGRLSNWDINCRYRLKNSLKLFSKVDLHVSVSSYIESILTAFPFLPSDIYNQGYNKILKIAQKSMDSKIELKNSIILHNGVDFNEFYNKKINKLDALFTIGSIGNFNKEKDQITLIKAVEQILKKQKKVCLVLVGTGPTLEFCKNYVKEKNMEEEISFIPNLDRDELCSFYNKLNLFVLPSYFEGFGCVYTEAYACGIPFVGCFNQGIEDLIFDEDKTKWLIYPQDVNGLVEIIENFIKNPIKQRLTKEIEINKLIDHFLTQIEILKQ